MIWWVIFFFIAGMVLILAEFILPGLVCGVLGGVFLTVSCVIAAYSHPEMSLFIVIGEIVAAIATIGVGFYVFPRSAIGKAIILETDQPLEAGWVSDETDQSLLGTLGEVFTALRPAGTITVNGRKVSAVSTGDFIGEGTAVRVVDVRGNRVVVESAQKL